MTEYRVHDREEILQRLSQGLGHFQGDTLHGLDLSQGETAEFSASGCRCQGVKFSGRKNEATRLTDSVFQACKLDRSGWSGLAVSGGQWEQCDCREALFTRARLSQWAVLETIFSNADFSGAHLVDCRFLNCEFFGAVCRDAVFIRTRFSTDNYLGKNNFQRADLARTLWVDADLAGTDFTGANLQAAVFARSNLAEADFTTANLEGAMFIGCRK